MGLKIYSANEVTFNFSGLNIDSGRGDDEFVRIEQQEDNFSYKAGVDGEGTRSESKNRYTVVTATLMQTSDGNALLSAIQNLDIKTPGGAGVAPLLVRDRQGNSVFMAAEAWIIKPPDRTYGKEAATVEWTFGVHSPERFDGGN
jgi:hypothetical protein